MILATVEDVQARLGRELADSELVQAEAWIGDVQAMIEARIPDIHERVDSGLVSPLVASAVVANAVIRKVNNPMGKQNERIDDYSYGWNADAARGELFLTAEEWGLLSPGSASGAFSIRPAGHGRGRGAWLTGSDWVPLP